MAKEANVPIWFEPVVVAESVRTSESLNQVSGNSFIYMEALASIYSKIYRH